MPLTFSGLPAAARNAILLTRRSTDRALREMRSCCVCEFKGSQGACLVVPVRGFGIPPGKGRSSVFLETHPPWGGGNQRDPCVSVEKKVGRGETKHPTALNSSRKEVNSHNPPGRVCQKQNTHTPMGIFKNPRGRFFIFLFYNMSVVEPTRFL